MAFTQEQEAKLVELLAAFENGKRINELAPAEGELSAMRIEVMDGSGESRSMELERAVAEAGNPIAGRWWDNTKSTPTAGGWFGSLDALRKLPETLGLGRYLVTDDHKRRKLDPQNSHRFADGSPAALDGSMGQCMWGWSRPWYFTEIVTAARTYWAITLKPLEGYKSVRIPVGSTSWVGAGVMDRTEQKLCSVISDDERYRGGNGKARPDTDKNHPAAGTPQASMLGMAATSISTTTFGNNARKRGEGWEANWFVAQAAVQILFAVIMGTKDSQAPYNPEKDADGLYQGGFGAGVTSMNYDKWLNYNGVCPLVPTSVGVELGDSNGLVEYAVPGSENAEDPETPLITFQVPCFFGLMHAGYGHLWRWTRGVIMDAGEESSPVYIAPSMYADYNPETVEDKIHVADAARADGYIKRLSTVGLCMIPTEVGGSASTYFPDYFYTNWQTSGGGGGVSASVLLAVARAMARLRVRSASLRTTRLRMRMRTARRPSANLRTTRRLRHDAARSAKRERRHESRISERTTQGAGAGEPGSVQQVL